MKFDKASMRKRYWEVADNIAAIEKDLAPTRAKYGEYRAKICALQAEARPLAEKIKKAQTEKLADLQNERAALARAIGQVGERP